MLKAKGTESPTATAGGAVCTTGGANGCAGLCALRDFAYGPAQSPAHRARIVQAAHEWGEVGNRKVGYIEPY